MRPFILVKWLPPVKWEFEPSHGTKKRMVLVVGLMTTGVRRNCVRDSL